MRIRLYRRFMVRHLHRLRLRHKAYLCLKKLTSRFPLFANSFERTGNDGTNELCSKRACDAGWTCDCNGDYFCTQADIPVYTLIDFNDFQLTTNVPCQLTTQRTITSSGFQLGFFHPQFSDTGLLAGQCQVFAWWLNGVLQNNFASPTTVTSANLATVKASMSDWNLLALRSGSVVGMLIYLLIAWFDI